MQREKEREMREERSAEMAVFEFRKKKQKVFLPNELYKILPKKKGII